MVTPHWVAVMHQEELLNATEPVTDAWQWVWDLTFNRLTIPLEPYHRKVWLFGTKEAKWIDVVTDHGRVVETQVPIGLPANPRSK
jgi:hypothetical protein